MAKQEEPIVINEKLQERIATKNKAAQDAQAALAEIVDIARDVAGVNGDHDLVMLPGGQMAFVKREVNDGAID